MISFQNVNLHYGERKLFDDISFQINPNDAIGLVGKNGAGKSTLFKAILDMVRIDSGLITTPAGIKIGYLPQELSYKDNTTVLEEAKSAFVDLIQLEKEIQHLNCELEVRRDYESGEYLELVDLVAEKSERLQMINASTVESDTIKTLTGLGFRETDMKRPTSEFSGGWRMRIELAKILLKSPDVFLLDEPTNHLDIESIQWLENFLKQYHGAIVLISHDKAFLNNITKRTLEISLGKIYDYKVPYSEYVGLRRERRMQMLAAYKNQQKQIEDTQEFINRFRYKATKAVQVQSRIKQLDRMEMIEIEDEDLSTMNVRFPPAPRAGTVVIKADQITKQYDDHIVLDMVDLIVERGEKIAFVGRNGEGKTTLSRIITGDLDFKGGCRLGHNVSIGYYAQNQDELLDTNRTVLETIDQVAVGDIRMKIRDILGAFLFSGEDVDKKVKVLSGGEKSRLALAKLLLKPYNLLVLDEPTNHLDMHSKDILKQALKLYDGTLIVVSHDREFLNDLTDKIYEFKNRKIHEYRGGIYDFLKKRKIDTLDALNLKNKTGENAKSKTESSDQKRLFAKRKELDKKMRKIENNIVSIEKRIEKAELEIEGMELIMKKSNKALDIDFYKTYEMLKHKVNLALSDWEKFHNVLEELKAERNSLL